MIPVARPTERSAAIAVAVESRCLSVLAFQRVKGGLVLLLSSETVMFDKTLSATRLLRRDAPEAVISHIGLAPCINGLRGLVVDLQAAVILRCRRYPYNLGSHEAE